MTDIREESRTREGSGCIMPEPSITNREPTGHPEVPQDDEGLFEMRNRAKFIFQRMFLTTLATFGTFMIPASASAQTACSPTINSCG